MEVTLIIIGILAVIGLIIWAAWFYEKKRSEALQAIANALNFSFLRKGDDSLITSNAHFNLFSRGRSKKVSNIMNGRANDMDITIMDYQYTTGSGKNSHTWSQSLIIVQSNLLQLPSFALSPENFFHKIGTIFGYKDIDFASHPKFSKQYLLRGNDEEAIRNTFSDELLKFYEKHKELSTEGEADKFIFFKAGKRLAPKNIQAFLQEALNMFGHIKTKTSGLH
jgi:hypothetical protein